MKPLLVGEANPYGADPEFALYPLPERASGDRLCRLVMGLERRDYLERFDRVNLCPQRWSAPAARENAAQIYAGAHDRIVLLGAKVARAFGLDYAPFAVTRARDGCGHPGMFANACPPQRERVIVVLPHPSALCRAWNEPGAFGRARQALVDAGVI